MTDRKLTAVLIALLVLPSGACSEDRCRKGTGRTRDLLEDTPPFGLCRDDWVFFSPSRLLFRVQDGASDAGAASPELLSVAADAVPEVAVLTQSAEGVPRSHAVLDVYECACSPDVNGHGLLKLAPADDSCSALSGSRLRCTTDLQGSARLRVTPSAELVGSTNSTCVCAARYGTPVPGSDGKPTKDQPLYVELQGLVSSSASVAFARSEFHVPTQSFGLSCGGACDAAPRRAQIDLRFDDGSELCDGGAECQPPASAVTVSLRLTRSGTSTLPVDRDAWWDSDGTCSRGRSELRTTFAAGSLEAHAVLCVTGAAAEYRVVAQLTGSGISPTEAVARIVVHPSPILVVLDTATSIANPSDAGTSPFTDRFTWRYTYCDGSSVDDWSYVAPDAQVALTIPTLPSVPQVILSAKQSTVTSISASARDALPDLVTATLSGTGATSLTCPWLNVARLGSSTP